MCFTCNYAINFYSFKYNILKKNLNEIKIKRLQSIDREGSTSK